VALAAKPVILESVRVWMGELVQVLALVQFLETELEQKYVHEPEWEQTLEPEQVQELGQA
jgi:hypothetical protein